jgi:CheY-like chemotaxis protein
MASRLDYVVRAASSPSKALELAQDVSSPIALMLTDIDMPGMNGFQLARRIRCHRPNLKVVFMSGNPYSQDFGGGPFLQKPFTLEQLAVALQT